MTVTHRRLLYGLAFVLFLIAAPLIVAYASGYRFDPAVKRLYKTGFLSFETSVPADKVVFDGKTIENPGGSIRIGELAPGTYALMIQKSGYLPWTQNITIAAGSATLLGRIQLLRDMTPTVIATDVSFFQTSPNETFVALGHQNLSSLAIIQLSDMSSTTYPLPGVPTALSWSPDSRTIAVQTPTDWFLLTVSSKTVQPLHTLRQTTSVVWDKQKAGHLLALRGNDLIDVTATTDSAFLIDKNVFSFSQMSRGVIALRQDATYTTLTTYPSSGARKLLRFTSNSPLKLLSSSGSLTVVERVASTSLLNLSAPVLQEENLPWATSVQWSADSKVLVLANEFELNVTDTTTGKTMLLTRRSEPISAYALLDDLSSLAISFTDSLRIMSLAVPTRESNQTLPLSSVTFMQSLNRGHRLLLYGSGILRFIDL